MVKFNPKSKNILRGALLGCGHVSPFHLKAWSRIPEVKIIALANRTFEKAENRAREFGISLDHVYSDYEELLDKEDLDFVDIATAPHIHRQQVEAAAQRGLHVLCQKPFAPTLEDAKAMIKICQQAKVLFSINENWRWRSWYREIKQMLDKDLIGLPCYIRFERHYSATLPLSDGSIPVVFRNQPYMQKMKHLIVYEWGVHLIDVLRFFFGEVNSVYARLEKVSNICAGEDRALITLDVGGVTCLIDISWATVPGDERISQLERVVIEGDKGTIELLPHQGDLLRLATKETCWEKPAFSSKPEEAYQESYNAAQQHFIECLINGINPETEASDNYKTLAATFAIYESSVKNQVVNTFQW
jgi:predicted dehydrogenase